MKHIRKCCVAVSVLFLLCALALSVCMASAEETPSGTFFRQTAPTGAGYGTISSAPAYQGEDGITLLFGSPGQMRPMIASDGGYAAGTAAEAARWTDGYRAVPSGGDSAILRWKAFAGGRVTFRGMAYNFYRYADDTDLAAAYGVAQRVQAPSEERGKITIDVYRTDGSATEILYQSGASENDFCLFIDEIAYDVRAGDEFLIVIGGSGAYCDVALYFDATFERMSAYYDFTAGEAEDIFADRTGNGNEIRLGYQFRSPEFDAEKGIRFTGGKSTDSFLFMQEYNTEPDFTDSLTDFSLRFTIIPEAGESWQYVLSTTCGDQWTKGFAVRTEFMGADASSGYALKLCINDGGKGSTDDFFFTNNGWITTLKVGNSYDVVVNISKTQRRAQMSATGTFFDGWTGTIYTGQINIAENWTMENDLNGLTVGAQNESGQEGFNGWVKDLGFYPYCAGTNGVGIADSPAVADIQTALPSADWTADEADLIAAYVEAGNGEVTLRLDDGGTATAKVAWSAFYDDGEYYLAGMAAADGYSGTVSVRADIDAYVATLLEDGRSIGFLSCGNDGMQKFALDSYRPAQQGYIYEHWYTDAALQSPFDEEQTITADVVLYGKATAAVYTIVYELEGGENPAEAKQSYTVEDSFALPVPHREGYTFGGWYTSRNFAQGTELERVENRTGELILYAKWNAIIYTITADSATGGSIRVASGAAFGEPVRVDAVPQEGYRLQSLTVTAADGTDIVLEDAGLFTMPAQNVTVQAVFAAASDGTGEETPAGGLGTGAVIGIVVAAIAVVGAAIAVPLLLKKKKSGPRH